MGRRVSRSKKGVERALEVYVDDNLPITRPEDLPKLGKNATPEQQAEIYTMLRLRGHTWGQISDIMGKPRRTLFNFRRKHEKLMVDTVERLFFGVIGKDEAAKAFLMLIRQGNVEALKAFAYIVGWATTGSRGAEVESEGGKIPLLEAMRRAVESGDGHKGT